MPPAWKPAGQSFAVDGISLPPELGGDFPDAVVGLLGVDLVNPVHKADVLGAFTLRLVIIARTA